MKVKWRREERPAWPASGPGNAFGPGILPWASGLWDAREQSEIRRSASFNATEPLIFKYSYAGGVWRKSDAQAFVVMATIALSSSGVIPGTHATRRRGCVTRKEPASLICTGR
jgi:hypothetical protein